MITWYQGINLLRKAFYSDRLPITELITHLQKSTKVHSIPGMHAIFISEAGDLSGGSLLHYLKLSHTLPEKVMILSTVVEDIPYVRDADRFEFIPIAEGFSRIILHYGFMQMVDVPEAFKEAIKRKKIPIAMDVKHNATFFVEHMSFSIAKQHQQYFTPWRKKLFRFLHHNSLTGVQFYRLPLNRTITIGAYGEI